MKANRQHGSEVATTPALAGAAYTCRVHAKEEEKHAGRACRTVIAERAASRAKQAEMMVRTVREPWAGGGARTETANRQRVARQHMQQHGLTDGALLRCTCTCLCARPPARSIALRPSLQAAERDSAWPVGGVAVRADHGQRHAPALHYLCMLASLVAAFPLQYLPRARCRAARVGCNPTKPCRSPVT